MTSLRARVTKSEEIRGDFVIPILQDRWRKYNVTKLSRSKSEAPISKLHVLTHSRNTLVKSITRSFGQDTCRKERSWTWRARMQVLGL